MGPQTDSSASDVPGSLPIRGVKLWLPALLAMIGGLITIDGDFVYDDLWAIVANPIVTGEAPAWEAFVRDFWGLPLEEAVYTYRPLVPLLWKALWNLDPASPLPFRICALALHLLCTVLLQRLVARGLNHEVAFWTAALFALHPVHAETMGSMVGLADLACASAGLAALLCGWASGRRACLSSLGLVVACLCKEFGLLFVLVACACELLGEPRSKSRDNNWRLAPLVIFSLGWVVLQASFDRVPVHDPINNIGLLATGTTAFAYAFYMVARCAAMCFIPGSQAPNHGYAATDLSLEHLLPYAIPGALISVGLTLLIVWALWKRKVLVLSALILFAGPIATQTNFFFNTVADLAERLLYLPSMVSCVLLAMGIVRLGVRSKRAAQLGAGLVLVFGLVLFTTQRPYRSDYTLWTYAVDVEPRSIRSQRNYASVLYKNWEFSEAAWHGLLSQYLELQMPQPIDWAPIAELEMMMVSERLARAPGVLVPEKSCYFVQVFLHRLARIQPEVRQEREGAWLRRYCSKGR